MPTHTLRVILKKKVLTCQNQNVSTTELFSVERIIDYCLGDTYSIREVNAYKSWKANIRRFLFCALSVEVLIFRLHFGHSKLFCEIRGKSRNAELHSDSPATWHILLILSRHGQPILQDCVSLYDSSYFQHILHRVSH